MKRFLAIAILGGALVATASAAFADDGLHGFPQNSSVQGVVLSQGTGVVTAGGESQPAPITGYQNK